MSEPAPYFEFRATRFVRIGMIIFALFLGLIMVSAFLLRIDGAVVSSAHIISNGKNKIVQHPEGGTIGELLVANGQHVEAGTPLVILDGEAIRSEFNVAVFRQLELRVKLARLRARLAGDASFDFNWLRMSGRDERLKKIVATQEKVFTASRNAYLSGTTALRDRISFLGQEIEALDLQIATMSKQLVIIDKQLEEVGPLVDDQLVAKSREWQLVRDQINAQEKLDSLSVVRVKTGSALSEARNELIRLTTDDRQNLQSEIEDTETELQSVDQSYERLNDRLARLVIKSPAEGMVHDLKFRNEQAVIRPGESIMEIVPVSSGYEAVARISPADIDQVSFGQTVRLRFDSMDIARTPLLHGTVKEISADRLTDENTGMQYYEVYVDIDDTELERLGTVEIMSGMPATALLKTKDRSLLSYLIRPVEQQVSRAFH